MDLNGNMPKHYGIWLKFSVVKAKIKLFHLVILFFTRCVFSRIFLSRHFVYIMILFVYTCKYTKFWPSKYIKNTSRTKKIKEPAERFLS